MNVNPYDYDVMNVNRQVTIGVVDLVIPVQCFYKTCHGGQSCESASHAVHIRGAWNGGEFYPLRERVIYMCDTHMREWTANHPTPSTLMCAKRGCESVATQFPVVLGGAMPMCAQHAAELERKEPRKESAK